MTAPFPPSATRPGAAPAAEAPAPPVGSPCTGVCRMDPGTGWCLGCARTLDEIAAWSTLDDPARRAVWQRLPPRQARLKALHGEFPAPRSPR